MLITAQDTAVVILSYNGKKWHELFLPLIVSEASAGYTVVVVDNASTDDTASYIRTNFPSVSLLQIPVNKGFAHGYATALQQIQSKYYVLLSADFEVTQGWFAPLYNAMERDEQLAACQPKIRYWRERQQFEYAGAAGGFKDSLGYMFCRGRILDVLENDLGQYDDDIELFWASGGCLFVRADLYHKVGGLDEDFYAHMEEIDLCWRLKNAGYKIGYIASATVYHVGGSVISYGSPQKLFYNFRNSLVLMLKNERLGRLLWLLPFRMVLDGIAAFHLLSQGKRIEFLTVVKAHFNFYGSLRKWLRHRAKAQRVIVATPNKNGIYKGSIIWQYYFKKQKTFDKLEWLPKKLDL
ncbi:MAG: glycosyltransferase family 2 protein [Chitinophagaceae bacterium]|nr:glycosyltransferase family 2 protein [Chitinophagaceae bacterium]